MRQWKVVGWKQQLISGGRVAYERCSVQGLLADTPEEALASFRREHPAYKDVVDVELQEGERA